MTSSGPVPAPHVGLLLGCALLGAAIAAAVAVVSGDLTPAGVAVVAAAGALAGSCLSAMSTRTGPLWVWLLVLVVAVGGGAAAAAKLRKEPDNPGVIRFVGGCAPFRVFAQNRWLPYGAAIRSGPSIHNKQLAARDPNQSITVNGWVHGDVAYPTNRAPWNNDVWFHLADGAGWVSFAGVRATPTDRDPTGRAEGGTPAPVRAACQGEAQ